MKDIVIGTGGHIDHGKSTLVKALTGIDPDRLAEEKKRGITIDLGFAHYQDNDFTVSFVDVPGHQRFIHNMMAGVAGIDMLLLVIAADDGVMPQTIEHTQICDLLGIQSGIIAITKCDTAEDDLLDILEEEIESLVQNTFLEEMPIVRVSAHAGTGLDVLKKILKSQAGKIELNRHQNGFRMPIDRVFTVKGFGTIVTGTVTIGSLKPADSVSLYPSEKTIRIRGLQAYGKSVETIKQGQRAAINLTSIHKNEIQRGNQITSSHFLVTSKVFDVQLRILENKQGLLKNRHPVKFYSGTKESYGRFITYQSFDSKNTDWQFAQIRLKTPISCRYGDKFILRNTSPLDTIAGGKIIAPLGNRSRKNRHRLKESLTALASDTPGQRILETIFLSGTRGITLQELGSLTDVSAKRIQNSLANLTSQNSILLINADYKKYLHIFHCARIAQFIQKALQKYHIRYPERPGAPQSEFSGKMSRMLSSIEIAVILQWAWKQKMVVKENNVYHLPDFKGHLNFQQKQIKQEIIHELNQNQFHPPNLTILAEVLGRTKSELEEVLKIGLGEKWSVRVKEDIWYLSDHIERIEEQLIQFLQKNETISIIQFKELLGITRKNAVALLEFFDSKHLTRRIDNIRILRVSPS